MVFSPELSPFAEHYALNNPEGWLCAATLTLPPYSPVLFVSVYAPSDKRAELEELLVPLLQKHDHYIIGGDFNAVPCTLLDLILTDDHPWHWLRQSVTSTPPRLIDTYRLVNPLTSECTRYRTQSRLSQKRIDLILASPANLPHVSLLDASIDTQNRTTDHHPVDAIFDVPSPTSRGLTLLMSRVVLLGRLVLHVLKCLRGWEPVHDVTVTEPNPLTS